jgi:hypothetical protein
MPRRRPPWLLIVFLSVGLLLVYGGVSTFGDQRSGTPGTAKVTECTGGTKYDKGIHCRGVWEVGGDAIFGEGDLVVGRVEGASHRDVGKEIDVRIHGHDHATVPGLGTSIMLWVLGGAIALFSVWALVGWWRRPDLRIPPAVREYLDGLVRQRWSGKDPDPVLATLPSAMPEGVVQKLVGGGPYGWLIHARLDRVDGRVALEALEDDRMSGPDHYRVWDDGTREVLPNERIAYVTEKDATPEEIERVRQEYHEHNHAVQQQLKERGF